MKQPSVSQFVLSTLVVFLGHNPTASPASQPPSTPAATTRTASLPHLQFFPATREVHVECQAIGVNAPLEFFCVVSGTAEHEAVLRTDARPSDIHTALLAIGMTPGSTLRYDPNTDKWLPPTGPKIDILVSWQQNGQNIQKPAAALIRNLRTKQPLPEIHWVFAGSRLLPDSAYAADLTGHVAALVNFESATLDVPEIASNANQSLTLEANLEALPPPNTPVTMILKAR